MKLRSMSVAALVGVSLVAGCSANTDYDASAAPKSDSRPADVPRWIRDGVRIAKATKAARTSTPTGDGSLDRTITTSVSTDPASLPSRDVVVAALTGAGMTPTQANCIYDGVSANPQTAADVTAILTSLAAAPATGAAGAAFDPASIPALANLSTESTTRLVMVLAPCLDQATLVGLMAAGQGFGGAGGTDAIAALLGSAQGLDLAKLAGFDPAAIAQAAAGALGSEQVQQLQALLAAAGSLQNGGLESLAPLLNNPLLTLDITKLDLSKLTKEEMPLLVLALLKGLSGDQQGQLMKLAQVNLDQLNLKIDPDDLTPEEIGSLILILSPLLAGAIKTTPATAPPGADPAQVYIPPGADLSNMNPLIFLSRADVIAQFSKQGIDPNVGGCIFDGMARLEPSTIAAFFSEEAGAAAAGAVLLTAVSCLAQNR